MADLDAAAAYVAKSPAGKGKITAVGFCWGGSTVFKFANHNRDLKATYVFYGRGPTDRAGAENIQGPVYGFYAENDARVNETLPETTGGHESRRQNIRAADLSGRGARVHESRRGAGRLRGQPPGARRFVVTLEIASGATLRAA